MPTSARSWSRALVAFGLVAVALALAPTQALARPHHRRRASCRLLHDHRRHRRHGQGLCHRRRESARRGARPWRRRLDARAARAGVSLYWGAYIGGQFTGSQPPWDWQALTDFEQADAAGKQVSLLPFGSWFYSSGDCGGDCSFPTSLFDKIRSAGIIPWFSWQTQGSVNWTDQQIATGAEDSYITQWAQAAKAWGHPFFLRFDWEMNGNWFPWGVGTNGNTAADYVAMWRHVHDIFTQVGATNVTWVWCPNIDPAGTLAPLTSLYPGDSYVDWTCLDGYNGDDPWSSFNDLFASTYNQLQTIAPTKPVAVGETASTETGGSKATWITNLLTSLPTSFPAIHALLWYDISSPGPGGHSDWPIEERPGASSAFAVGIRASAYAAANYANLDASPIPAPS
jgi:hypothetical protein